MNIKEIKSAKRFEIPCGHCVYFLTDKSGKILYVGRSDMRTISRIADHNKTKKFDDVYIKYCKSKQESMEFEARMIFNTMPSLNKKIEMRREMGVVSELDIKKEIGVTKPLTKRVAKENNIEPIIFNGTVYYPKEIKNKIRKYLVENEEKFKGRSNNQIR